MLSSVQAAFHGELEVIFVLFISVDYHIIHINPSSTILLEILLGTLVIKVGFPRENGTIGEGI